MTITLSIIEPQNLPPEQESHIIFDARGGKIGRSPLPTNDWVLLNDYVSRVHATIEYREDGYYVVNNSSTGTGIQSPDEAEEYYLQEEERKLNSGDILLIGEYDIEVSIQEVISSPLPVEDEPKPVAESQSITRPKQVKTTTSRTTTKIPPIKSTASSSPPEQLPKTSPSDVQEAIYAFLEGTELADNISIDKIDPDLMRTLGQAFRLTMEGVVKLMEARKTFKIEADLEATRFAGGLNNPLKVSQDPGMILEIMLSRRKGYLSLLESLEEAFEDIEAHLLAMGKGVTESLKNTLEVFSPEEIERVVEQQQKSKWFNSESNKWKEFVERYNKLEINKLLSEELARAYEDQIDRLNRRR